MKAVFLDRDGVIIRKALDDGYIADWSEVEFLPGSIEAIRTLHKQGFMVIVVTNQRGVATGRIDLSSLEDIHTRLRAVVSDNGGTISAIYFCPHLIAENCSCRKPKPGMLLRAAKDHGLNLSECWMVGDSLTDIEAGRRAGCRTVLISSSSGRQEPKPDVCERALSVAVNRILETEKSRTPQTVRKREHRLSEKHTSGRSNSLQKY